MRAATVPGRPAHAALQEQRRRQGRQLRLPRELPHGPPDHVPVDRGRAHPVLRLPAGRHGCRPGRAGRRPATRRATSSPSAATTSRSRSAWRPRSSAASSTPATSRTPTPTSTAACTSSSATRTCQRVLDAAQGRHHRAGARHDREGRPVRRAAPERARALGAPDQPRPDAEDDRRADRRPQGHRAGPAAGLLREGRQARREHDGRRRRPGHRRGSRAVGHGPRRPGPRPAELRGPPRLGRRSCGCWRATASATG